MTYGCFDRGEYVTESSVQDGWNEDGTRKVIQIPFKMTRDCQYTFTELGQKDHGCVGCKWRHNEFS